MKILVIGSSGFIGSHIYKHLQQQGYDVVACQRSISQQTSRSYDFQCDMNLDKHQWMNHLNHIHIVINCVGIFQNGDNHNNSFEQVHHQGPKALFQACEQKKIRVIQISAIGAEQDQPANKFLSSKKQADEYLLNSAMDARIIYPGIVIGAGGKSTKTLTQIAQWPIIPLLFPKNYHLPVIPLKVLLQRVVAAIDTWCETPVQQCLYENIGISDFFIQCRQYLYQYQHKGDNNPPQKKINSPWFISFPKCFTQAVFRLIPQLQFGQFNQQSLQMLDSYNHPNSPYSKPSSQHFEPLFSYLDKNDRADLKQARIRFYFIAVLSFIWCWSGLVSLFNPAASLTLMEQLSIIGYPAVGFIFAGAIIDLILGTLIWWSGLRRWVLYGQALIMVGYSIIVSLFMADYWFHPFAPMIKNLPIFLLIGYLLVFDSSDGGS